MKLKELTISSLRAAWTFNNTPKPIIEKAEADFKKAKSFHQNIVRKYNVKQKVKHDDDLNEKI